MTVLERHHTQATTFRGRRQAVVARLAADLVVVMDAIDDGVGFAEALVRIMHERVLSAYCATLSNAAERPEAATWDSFEIVTAAFVVLIPREVGFLAEAAARRLRAIHTT